ncbi:MAG: acetylglutamate kinase [Planctomycetes bacterium]|nr:acetylglutamate kinase [Planctomycetota bacterium]
MTFADDRSATMDALKRALPYVRLFKGKTFVVKIGGAPCSEPAQLRELAEQLSVVRELGVHVVLVHGGGPQTTELSKKLGLQPRMIEGRRVTDAAALDVAVMTMNGSVGTAVLSACRAVGLQAVGVSGLDAGLVKARRRAPRSVIVDGAPQMVDFGHVGDVEQVDPTLLKSLLAAGYLPVVSPLSADEQGNVLNINADTVAASLARALCAEKLVFVSDVPGILEDRNDPSSLISCTDLRGLEELVENGSVTTGMLPKISAIRMALDQGVARVHVIGNQRASLLTEIFTNEGSGTLIVRDRRELSAAEKAASGETSNGATASTAAGISAAAASAPPEAARAMGA